MATPTSLRDGIAALTREARRDLFALWDRLAGTPDIEAALRDVLPTLIDQYGVAAAALAADWYDEIRDEAAPAKRFRAVTAEVGAAGTQELIGWALATGATDNGTRMLVDGGMQRRISNVSRATVTRSAIADPSAVGWKRIGYGACEFCRMLIQREQTYTQATADFASHDHCNCQAYPLIKGAEPVDVKKYVQSPRNSQKVGESDEAYQRRREVDRKRVREWIADNQ